MLLKWLVALLFTVQMAFASEQMFDKCEPCNELLCPNATDCPMGIFKDRCGCCNVCGLEQGHRCNTREELSDIVLGRRTFGYYGLCGRDLECRARTDVSEELQGRENICVCSKPGRVCASNGETYSVCEMAAVEAKSGGEIFLVSYDDCKTEPKIVAASPSVEVEDGNKTTLWCEIKGYPIPSVTWYFKPPDSGYDAILLPGDSDEMSVSLRGAPPGRRIISHLQISSFGIKHEGTYQCYVENDFGSDRHDIKAIYRPPSRNNKFRTFSMSDEV